MYILRIASKTICPTSVISNVFKGDTLKSFYCIFLGLLTITLNKFFNSLFCSKSFIYFLIIILN